MLRAATNSRPTTCKTQSHPEVSLFATQQWNNPKQSILYSVSNICASSKGSEDLSWSPKDEAKPEGSGSIRKILRYSHQLSIKFHATKDTSPLKEVHSRSRIQPPFSDEHVLKKFQRSTLDDSERRYLLANDLLAP